MRFSILLLVLLCQTLRAESPCPVKLRAVIDMGSGSTKLNMAQVQACPDKMRIEKEIEQDASRAVPLEGNKTSNDEIPPGSQQLALTALRELQNEVLQFAQKNNFPEFELAVVATQALRTARNRAEVLKKFADAGFEVRVLTQDEEAEAGFEAVLASPLPAECKKENLLVWDVGGGSTQLTRAQTGNPNVVKLNLGAESYRKRLLSTLKPRKASTCPANPESPNPVGRKNLPAARALIGKETHLEADQLQSSCVIGIGGVHNKAVFAQLEKNWSKLKACACKGETSCVRSENGYRKKDLECLAQNFASKSDCDPEIKGPYAATSVSNLAMVLGFMDQLKIERVFTLPINMGNYFVLDRKRLSFKTVKTTLH